MIPHIPDPVSAIKVALTGTLQSFCFNSQW
jgi:hypothetical protein